MPDFLFTWHNPLKQFSLGLAFANGELKNEENGKIEKVKCFTIGLFIFSLNFLWRSRKN